jgi:putative phosphoesterase
VRVVILSDTHGRIDPELLELARTAELVVHAGDVGGAHVLEQLADGARPVLAVRGNNDDATRWAPEEHAALASLPDRLRVELPGGTLAVEHGHRAGPVRERHARLRRRHPDVRAVVYGHSHRAVIDDEAEPWVLNPGAAGRERCYGGASCLILEAEPQGWAVQRRRARGGRRR